MKFIDDFLVKIRAYNIEPQKVYINVQTVELMVSDQELNKTIEILNDMKGLLVLNFKNMLVKWKLLDYETGTIFTFIIYSNFLKKNQKTKKWFYNKAIVKSGTLISFVGLDGAGKSTTSMIISEWLNKDFVNVRYLYMGEGDGKTPYIVGFLKKITGRTGNKVLVHGYFYALFSSLMFLYVAKSNYRKIARYLRNKKKGLICITDRYPQMESCNMNNGPKICRYQAEYPNSVLIKYYNKIECEKIEETVITKPDLIVRLNVTVPTSMKRHPKQTNPEYFHHKLNVFNSITFNNSYIVDVNSEQNFDNELLEIKKIVWENLIKTTK